MKVELLAPPVPMRLWKLHLKRGGCCLSGRSEVRCPRVCGQSGSGTVDPGDRSGTSEGKAAVSDHQYAVKKPGTGRRTICVSGTTLRGGTGRSHRSGSRGDGIY